jgi:Mrp family chromosome partitioning ATPase
MDELSRTCAAALTSSSWILRRSWRADARVLAQKADATVMVVHWAKTRRESVRRALRQLTGTAGVRLAGVVLSQVDARKHAQYSYGDSGAYAGDLEKYYVG